MSGAEDHHLDELLDAVLIGGREQRRIVIVDYSPDWPRRFEAERCRIDCALGPVAVAVEHIGSTAVPGLGAKPIVDIMVTVADADDESSYVSQLEAAAYVLRVREAGHRMFRTSPPDVHLHVWSSGSEDERRQLVFRDWLRSHPVDCAKYEEAKRELAGRWSDMNYYAAAKGAVINDILERAEGAAGGSS